MEWNNELILEFLTLYENHPVIWDPKNMEHKNRTKVSDAWENIRKNLSMDFSVIILKKKKECLMATYRTIRKKVSDSKKSRTDDIYKPSWFAFEKMDSFLRKTIKVNVNSIFNEEVVTINDTENSTFNDEPEKEEILQQPSDDVQLRGFVGKNSPPSTSGKKFIRSTKKHSLKKKKHNRIKMDLNTSLKEAFNVIKTISEPNNRHQNAPDECTLYVQLLETKLRTLEKNVRTVVMNTIDNLVFRAKMGDVQVVSSSTQHSNVFTLHNTIQPQTTDNN